MNCTSYLLCYVNESHSLGYSLIVNTDAVRLQQIISNLLENAFKFTDEGRIELGYEIDRQDLIIYVKDTGMGIEASMHDLIFKRFRQLDYSSTKKYGGTGLGLSIIKGLIDLLEGSISLESTLGEGSVFRFRLPSVVVMVEQQKAVSNVSTPRQYNWSDKTFLIVEDERTNYNLLMIMLRPSKAKLVWAMDGQEAIDYVKQNPGAIDLILMDIRLPNVNGYEATIAIKKIDKSIPVIAQTAYAMDVEVQKAIQAGCDAYITKPIDRGQLLETIFRFVG